MGRLIKWLIYLALIASAALAGYAYVGPFFGADFSAPQREVRETVTIDVGQ